MQVKDLLHKIPKDLTDPLSDDTEVSEAIHQLQGSVLFNLLLYGVVRSEPLSITILNDLYNAPLFRASGYQPDQGVCIHNQHNEASRLRTHTLEKYMEGISAQHFKSILNWTIQQKHIPQENIKIKKKVEQTNPAIIRLSSRLLEWGLQPVPTGGGHETRFEVSVGGNELFDETTQLRSEKKGSENETARHMILKMTSGSDIVTIKPKVASPTTVEASDLQSTKFITSCTEILPYQIISQASHLPPEREGIQFLQDSIICFYHAGERFTDHFRLVKILDTTQGNRSYLVSNILDIDADLIMQVYRDRHSIESLF